jgi:hypothetical protein
MTKARILADFISDGSSLADGTISVAEVSGAAPLASPTFTGGIDVTGTVVADGNLTLGSSTNAYTLARLDHENVGGKAEIQLNAYGSASFSMLSNFTGSTLDGVATGNFGLITPHNAGISINTSGLERMKIDGSGNTVFNEGGVDADFRVESDTNDHMLFVDGGNNRVGIGHSAPATILDVHGTGAKINIRDLTSADTGVGGKISFQGYTSGTGSPNNFGLISGTKASGNVGGVLTLSTSATNGTMTDRMTISESGAATFNSTVTANSFLQTNSANYQHKFFLANGTTGVGYIYSTGSTFQLDTQAAQPMELLVNGASRLTLGTTGSATFTPTTAGHAVFNEGGVDADFRVESDTNTHALFVDAGLNRVGIGISVPASILHLNQDSGGAIYIASNILTTGAVPAWSTARVIGEIHASSGGDGGMLRLSAGGGANVGQKAGIDMSGYNTTDGGPKLRFYAGSLKAIIGESSTVFNEDGADQDFRVESDTNTHALFVQGNNGFVGIQNLDPKSTLEVGELGTQHGLMLNGGQNGAATCLEMVDGKGGSFTTLTIEVQLTGAGGYFYQVQVAGTSGCKFQTGGGYTNGTVNFGHTVGVGAGWTVTSPSNDLIRLVASSGVGVHPLGWIKFGHALNSNHGQGNVTFTWS